MNFLKIKSKYLFVFFSITISFGQNIETILPTLEIDTLLNNGSKNNRINIAFSNVTSPSGNEVYQSKSHLKEDINEILTYFNAQHSHAKSGFSNYQSFFNVFSVWFPDPLIFESKPEYYEKAQGIRDALFLPWADNENGWITMMYVFDGGGGGGAGNVREKRVGDALIYGLDWETVLHEFNHTMPGLYDEYTASGEWSNYECVEGPNVTGQNVIDEVPWRKWLDQDIAIPTPYESDYFNKVGLFEGNISGYFGCYRPTAKSCYMGAGGFGEGFGQDLCPVCLQRFITMLYKYVNVIENPLPASTQIEINGSETLTFSADIIKPEPNTQIYEWFVNGQLFATGQESININFDACDKYVVDLVVTDTTDAVRYDKKFKDIYPEPKQKHTWYVNQSAVSSYNLSIETIIKPADCNGIENGEIDISTAGGLPPYSYTLNGEEQDTSHIKNLEVGNYTIVVSDENGCSVIKDFEILQDAILDFKICSSYIQDSWGLSASLFTEDTGELAYLWSNGSTDPSILVEVNGIYSLEITNVTGCIVQREITLNDVTNPLTVIHHIGHSTENLNNGALYLDIEGGVEPYDIIWYKLNTQDKTLPLDNQVIASDISPWTPKVYAFNNNQGASEDFWAEEFTGSNYIGYDFGKATTIEYYSLTANVDTKERDAKSWIFQGSDDGDNWTDIEHINDIEFAERLQKIDFNLSAPVSFRFFRLKFSENWGSDRIVVQEFEFGAYVEEEIKQDKDKRDIQGLAPGNYRYKVTDLNNSCFEDKIEISNMESPTLNAIVVVQDGVYQVKIENPNPDLSYYWTEDNTGSNILHIGTDFRPPSMGTYYVRPFINSIAALGKEIKGFTVTMTNPPLIENKDGKIRILNPEENHSYYWYNELKGGEAVHTGIEFIPNSEGVYFVSAMEITEEITSIDPSTIEGVKLWMDASDLDGNGIKDHGIESSSAYSWQFREGGKWGDDSWFPYRGNFQNGLGIVDFSTMWFQYLSTNVQQMRTVILAYQESSFSFDKTAPLYGLNENIPRHSDASQLFSNDAPSTTLNGKTFLNGERVDPLTQNNPMDFIVLSVVFSDLINASPYASHENWEGKLGELIVWDIALSDDQIKGVNEFMRKKWLSIADLESNRVGVTWGEDSDGDGIMNLSDNCPETANTDQLDFDSDGIGDICDADIDNDGVLNPEDNCDYSTLGGIVDENGCFNIPNNNFTIEVFSETCANRSNGIINIIANEVHNYIASLNGNEQGFTNEIFIGELPPGNYDLCISVEGEDFEQCYNLKIAEGITISGKATITSKKTSISILKGTAPYKVIINGKEVLETYAITFDLDVSHGDLVEVKTKVSCEGIFSKTIDLFEKIKLQPNPTTGIFEVLVPLNLKEVAIEIYNSNSQQINSKTYPVVSGKVQLDIREQTSGVYLVKVLVQEPVTLKVVKK